MPTEYGDGTVAELEWLPPKQEYIANLRSVPPPADEPRCAICRGEWEYPVQEVVEPSPHCSRHPFHKDCLLITFATEDGEEVSNLCPFCRRELFEKIPKPLVDPPNNSNSTYQQTIQLYDSLVVLHSQIGYNDYKTEDPQLLYPSGPTIEDALQKDGFWSALPRFLDECYYRNASQIIEQTKTYKEPPSRKITGLTDEGRAAIMALFAHETDKSELYLKATELQDRLQGEIVMQCIRAALMYYDQSAFPQHVEHLQRETRWLIAYHVLTSLLTAHKRADGNFWYQGMGVNRWMQLIRFRKMLHQEIIQWASLTFFATLPPLEVTFHYGSLVGAAEGFGEHDLLEIQFFPPHDAEPYHIHTGPISRDHTLSMESSSVCPLAPNLKNITIFQFVKGGTLKIRELSHAFLYDVSRNPEEGFLDFINESGGMLRITRRSMEEGQ
ncbi:hypothetical protein J4E93_001482 [Alternaria ventricosa]|uniref:uncharacterized protein n=1 Tax=Alternaria ventricosa TaxID=1187951 RepID=UPI0020C485F6|nr:uncharacterized protein J4E93_001482 [Alternaria ventricosa]KAI4653715.1 hypothetical protein J4E93_001482 [Alternaria ventricosa]